MKFQYSEKKVKLPENVLLIEAQGGRRSGQGGEGG